MKNDPNFFCAILIAMVSLLLLLALIYENSLWEKAIGNERINIENLKRDCEKSLPRDKECVMVFDFVSAENDYE